MFVGDTRKRSDESSRVLPIYGSSYPRSLLAMESGNLLSAGEGKEGAQTLKLHNRLGERTDLHAKARGLNLEPKSDLPTAASGMSGMICTRGIPEREEEKEKNNPLFVNPSKNKQATIVVRGELLSLV